MMDDLLQKAIEFATEKHKGQMYGDKPYITHPLAVLERVKKVTNSPYIQAAAVLHDVVEDCEVTNWDVEKVFGHGVADIVLFLTNTCNSYAAYIETVSDHQAARVVKIADLEENIFNCTRPDQKHLKDKYELALLYLRK